MKYHPLPGLTPDGRIYWNAAMQTTEAMLPPGKFKTAHAPALLQTADGDLLCAWFAGSYEGSGDISIVCARLPKGAAKWEAPVQVSQDETRSEQNPSFFMAPDGIIWLIYTAQADRVAGKDNMQFTSIIRCQKSEDGGRTWGGARALFEREGSFCRQPIQILANGRWIFANWQCSDCAEGLAGDPTVIQISDDEGKTWRTVKIPQSEGRVHANIVELDPWQLAAFMRSRSADFIYRSESNDNGDTWSPPAPTSLPNNNSSISAAKLASGRVAIAYNPTCAPAPQAGVATWPGLRCPVAVALSEDGGHTWPLIRNMELGEGFTGAENRTNNMQYEYPCLMQAEDKMLHLAFAYQNRRGVKWMTFSEENVMGEKREAQGVYNPTSAQI